jgi:hypothetical protein
LEERAQGPDQWRIPLFDRELGIFRGPIEFLAHRVKDCEPGGKSTDLATPEILYQCICPARRLKSFMCHLVAPLPPVELARHALTGSLEGFEAVLVELNIQDGR